MSETVTNKQKEKGVRLDEVELSEWKPGCVIVLLTGAKVTLKFKDELRQWHAHVLCPLCPPSDNMGSVTIRTDKKSRRRFTGLCHDHAPSLRRTRPRIEHHISGADILWDEQFGPKTNLKVNFICRERDIGEHKDEAHVSQVQRSNWRGRCKPRANAS
jgi:hypothetical protein